MPMHRRTAVAAVTLTAGLALSACGSGVDETEPAQPTPATASSSDHADHSTGATADAHEHPADGGPPPAGIADAVDPTHPIGSDVVLSADHMPGMGGAGATIAGAFDTTAYSVSYAPTNGGAPVVDHKWVVHEELEDPGPAPLPEGSEVILRADHMPGMDGANATIDSSTQETVYMVDVHSEDMPMTNHKWVTKSEVQPAP